jgi:acetyl-CoA C-acetyltransferase
VTRFDLTREAQDRWAERSQQRFTAAQANRLFDKEIVALQIPSRSGAVTFARDEAPRRATTLEALSGLRPAFRPDGTITAGNAPGLNSGGAATIVASRSFADERGLDALVPIAGFGVAAVAPEMFGIGPVPPVRQAVERAGWSLHELDRVEINEAFAAVPLAMMKELGLPADIVDANGGAIAHGHPIGAIGAVLVTRLAHSMRRDELRRGLVTLCIGGGQGIALALGVV